MIRDMPLDITMVREQSWHLSRMVSLLHAVSLATQEMMECVRRHQVNLRGVVSTVVVTTLVLEGWWAPGQQLCYLW